MKGELSGKTIINFAAFRPKKVIGFMKGELSGKAIINFAAFRPKIYNYLIGSGDKN